MIIDFNGKRAEYEKKKELIFAVLLRYYKDLKETGVDIPYFLKAKNKYNELIKSNKDVNYYFNKIKDYAINI